MQVSVNEIDGFRARIRARRALAWHTELDREAAGTPHPRAASGLAWVGEEGARRLALVQDDACSIALVDPRAGLAEAIILPGLAGARRFDPGHGDKRDKPDLECCLGLRRDGVEVLLAFGSGSTGRRERVALVERRGARWAGRFVEAPGLYRALREEPRFAGAALNVEGVVAVGEYVWFLQRGNGGAHPALAAVSLEGLWRHLEGGEAPALEAVHPAALPAIEGVPLGFTDAALGAGDTLVWLASAEASPDTYDDGAVLGSVVGVGDRAALICEEDGEPFLGKAEGLALAGGRRVWVAVDPDDPATPAELLEVELPWDIAGA